MIGPPVDPTTLTPEELVAEIQRSIKALLALGARMPKELMLFVKNLVFLDGAIATLAPDLDLFAEIEGISLLFAEKHGERIMAQLGLAHQEGWRPDLDGMKASLGLDARTERLTHRDIEGAPGPGPPEVRGAGAATRAWAAASAGRSRPGRPGHELRASFAAKPDCHASGTPRGSAAGHGRVRPEGSTPGLTSPSARGLR